MRRPASSLALICLGLYACQLAGPEDEFITVRTDRQAYHKDSQVTLTVANESPSPLYLWYGCAQVDEIFGRAPIDTVAPIVRRYCQETTDWPPPATLAPGEEMRVTTGAGWDTGPDEEVVEYSEQFFLTLDREGSRPVPPNVTVSNRFTVWDTPAVWVVRYFSGGRQCDPESSYDPPDVVRLLQDAGAVVLDLAIEPSVVCFACYICPAWAARYAALVREQDLGIALAAGFELRDGTPPIVPHHSEFP
ncbi:MAG: hypothetical protein HKN37_14290 [Rhodothermales bacterium]|nr:hypothetical protein [Rhodothermales bacterium]